MNFWAVGLKNRPGHFLSIFSSPELDSRQMRLGRIERRPRLLPVRPLARAADGDRVREQFVRRNLQTPFQSAPGHIGIDAGIFAAYQLPMFVRARSTHRSLDRSIGMTWPRRDARPQSLVIV